MPNTTLISNEVATLDDMGSTSKPFFFPGTDSLLISAGGKSEVWETASANLGLAIFLSEGEVCLGVLVRCIKVRETEREKKKKRKKRN